MNDKITATIGSAIPKKYGAAFTGNRIACGSVLPVRKTPKQNQNQNQNQTSGHIRDHERDVAPLFARISHILPLIERHALIRKESVVEAGVSCHTRSVHEILMQLQITTHDTDVIG